MTGRVFFSLPSLLVAALMQASCAESAMTKMRDLPESSSSSQSSSEKSYLTPDLTSWGGGWRALRVLFSSGSTAEKSALAAELSTAAYANFQEVPHPKSSPASRSSLMDTVTPRHPDNVELPTGARWCEVRPCDGNAPFFMATYADNDYVSEGICKTGQWEHCDAREFTMANNGSATKPHVAIDIGGNIGYFSLLLANAGWQVVTVEPMPKNTQLLEASLKANPGMSSRVHLHKVGLSEQAGLKCGVYQHHHNYGDGHTECFKTDPELQAWLTEKTAVTDPDGYKITVGSFEVTTLDLLLQQEPVLSNAANGGVQFVKMDVEGFEGQVIKGGKSLLSLYKPPVIRSELWNNILHTTPSEFLNQFSEAGYVVDPPRETIVAKLIPDKVIIMDNIVLSLAGSAVHASSAVQRSSTVSLARHQNAKGK